MDEQHPRCLLRPNAPRAYVPLLLDCIACIIQIFSSMLPRLAPIILFPHIFFSSDSHPADVPPKFKVKCKLDSGRRCYGEPVTPPHPLPFIFLHVRWDVFPDLGAGAAMRRRA
jgi:hypothetical protein